MRSFFAAITCLFLSSSPIILADTAETKPRRKTADISDKLTGFIQVRLNEPVYKQGTLSTRAGGIITSQDLYIQAQNIFYTKTAAAHAILAEGNLYFTYKGKRYRGSKLSANLITNTLEIWDGCTQIDNWYVGGEKITIRAGSPMLFDNAYLSTSDNNRKDWSIQAATLTVEPGRSIQAKNVSFQFENVPLFWIPSYTKTLSESSGSSSQAPFGYRIHHGGSTGLQLSLSYKFSSFGPWKNKALAQYSFRNGFGAGLLTTYKGRGKYEKASFSNFIAPAKSEPLSINKMRYRLQGTYTNYYEEANIHCFAAYDKLSDRKMKQAFSDHPLTTTRPGQTEAVAWKEEANWLARARARARINNFQTVKQELPMLSWSYRTFNLGNSKWMIENNLSAGYLNYMYAKNTPKVHNFASTRSEIAQRLFRTYTLSPFIITPSAGYQLIHYSSSPQHEARTQIAGHAQIDTKTRFVRSSVSSFQSLEPYLTVSSMIRPSVRPGRSYIFDLEDGFARLNEAKVGIRHNFLCIGAPNNDPRIFQQKIFSDLYTRKFIDTPHASAASKKIWFNTVFDATAHSSLKLATAYDYYHRCVDHWAIALKYTFSSRLAAIFEYRERSRFAWRKLDIDNYIVDATRSERSLLKSGMSDPRQTFIASLFWALDPNTDLKLRSTTGYHHRGKRKRYHDVDISLITLIRGSLQIELSYGVRSLSEQSWSLSLHLGAKKQSRSTSFHKIGQGNYDVW